MTPRIKLLLCAPAATILMLACERDAVTAPTQHRATTATTAQTARHPYGAGQHGNVIAACQRAGYRQFDFWIGTWAVGALQANGSIFQAKSIINSKLDGCAVEENWQGFARSINTYDAATGTYHQQYMGVGGFHSQLSGTTQPDGSMRMTGRNVFNCPTCPDGLFLQDEVWTWTAITPDSVRQLMDVFNGRTGQYLGVGFDGRYRRDASIVLNPTPTNGFCTNHPRYQEFNFFVGNWGIFNGNAHGKSNANGAPVTATVTKELAGCLVEEYVEGVAGYRGWSYNSFSTQLSQWVRTYADNAGGRVFLKGNLVGTDMVLTGTRSTADGQQSHVRVTWSPDGENRVVERWEVSNDGGETYALENEVVRVRLE